MGSQIGIGIGICIGIGIIIEIRNSWIITWSLNTKIHMVMSGDSLMTDERVGDIVMMVIKKRGG